MSHALAGRRGRSGDEADHRLLVVCLDPAGRFLFFAAADLADQDHGVRLRVLGKELHAVDEGETVHRIAADTDGGALSHPQLRHLMHRFVRQRAGARDDPDAAPAMDVPGHDADLALAGRDHARAVRSDEARG